ncbi:class I SAM-dependent methyltransferase [Streptomyces sp. NPDC002755]|uniref:class I SAM-dependent methyltransferase n=1 Tax=Streptomyces sp. NPDC002884 TaxID=3154544 RepID=UPI00333282EA
MNATTTAVPGAPPAPGAGLAAQYDAFHRARARSDLVARLYAEAMGAEYPTEVGASSSCDWSLLGLMTARLQIPSGRLLMDAGCGTGGIGLWLARALSLRLVGFDLSAVAVAQAAARRPRFGLPAERAAFRVAALEDTGLPDSGVHGIVCVDALGLAGGRGAALREFGRVLVPGGRLVMTWSLRRSAEPAWQELASAAGLTVEYVDERPAEPAAWARLYQLWISHADALQCELGEDQAHNMLREAHRVLPTLPGRRAVLLTLRRSVPDQAGPGAVDTMTGPGRRPDERNPQ